MKTQTGGKDGSFYFHSYSPEDTTAENAALICHNTRSGRNKILYQIHGVFKP